MFCLLKLCHFVQLYVFAEIGYVVTGHDERVREGGLKCGWVWVGRMRNELGGTLSIAKVSIYHNSSHHSLIHPYIQEMVSFVATSPQSPNDTYKFTLTSEAHIALRRDVIGFTITFFTEMKHYPAWHQATTIPRVCKAEAAKLSKHEDKYIHLSAYDGGERVGQKRPPVLKPYAYIESGLEGARRFIEGKDASMFSPGECLDMAYSLQFLGELYLDQSLTNVAEFFKATALRNEGCYISG